MMAMHELVVPKSMPNTFDIVNSPESNQFVYHQYVNLRYHR